MEIIDANEVIIDFISEMRYLENNHVLGCYFYGSYLTGLNHRDSDIDLHIVFDDCDSEHLVRGVKYKSGIKIEYFEKPISDLYLSIDNGYNSRNAAWLSIIGTSRIIFDKTGQLNELQQYAIGKYKAPLPRLDSETAKEYVSIINNRMEKLEKCAAEKSPNFIHLYHLTIEKIRKFYHDVNGLAQVQTSKVYRVYTDEQYRESYSGYEIPEPEFVVKYLDAISDISSSYSERFEKVKRLFDLAKKGIDLGEEYRIQIKSRNQSTNKWLMIFAHINCQ